MCVVPDISQFRGGWSWVRQPTQVGQVRSGWQGQVVQVKLGKVIKVRLVGGQAAQTEYAGKRQKE